MSSSVVAGVSSSSSCSVARIATHHHPSKTIPCPSPLILQKSNFHGVSLSLSPTLHNAKRSVMKRGFEVKAKAAGASKTIEVEVDKPLGLSLGQKPAGGVIITAVDGGGNAARAGLKAGDQVVYTSSFFGDELWPADKLGFTKTAIQAKPESVYFVVSRGAVVDVKKLPKRPHPPRFGKKLTETQKAKATHICLDCGYIYTLTKPFEEQADGYVCPQCRAPKKRFSRYDVNTGKAIGGTLPPIGVIVGLLTGVAAIGALLVYGLQ